MTKIWISAIVALVVGGALGYWYGNKHGYDQARMEAAATAAAKSNPFNKPATTPTNPLDNIKVNPFK